MPNAITIAGCFSLVCLPQVPQQHLLVYSDLLFFQVQKIYRLLWKIEDEKIVNVKA